MTSGGTSTAPGSRTPIRFGYKLPIWDPKGTRAGEWWPQVLGHLEVLPAEYESIWLSDHMMPGVSWMSATTDTLEAWTTATALAVRYPTLRVGHLVLANSFRNPALVAKASATLQFITGGRFVLGLGAGWMDREYRALGYPFPSAAVRLAQLDEALTIIRSSWTGQPYKHSGTHYELESDGMNPAPDPPPPIVLGTGGESVGLRLVARHADWWNSPGVALGTFKQKVRVLQQRCEEIDRDPSSVLLTWQGQRVAIADSNAEAERLAAANPLAANSDESPIVGTPELVAELLAEYIGAGAGYLMLRFADFPSTDGLLRFASEVVPKLK
jgi:alkanesulfonate monooxygenase SsuD/methylene tetrahydromethanopterin reductase-like flavin-dependent oxidoreductase (luciferase family)